MLIRTLVFAFGFCFAGFGLYTSVAEFSRILHGYDVAQWPTVVATINTCELEQWAEEGTTTYRLDLGYSYTVDGTTHHAGGIHPVVHEGGEPVRSLFLALTGHQKVMVCYNPNNPSEAYLFGGGFTRHWGVVFGQLAFFTFGVLFSLVVHCALPSKAYFAKRLAVVR
ncbi:MAG: DUF3592 domain-containing protein [Candidatus Hydrogenedentes bacterium]|nr:DUF3592 domain-containing protein [Candidatus Hydrogenedentota bacterium]